VVQRSKTERELSLPHDGIAGRDGGRHRILFVEGSLSFAVATRLVNAAEDWFRKKNIQVVELSYMTKNKLAAMAWRRLGYEPFRVFAYKEL
jgi:hypothetical protein